MKKYIADDADVERRYFLNMGCGVRIDYTRLFEEKDEFRLECCKKRCVLRVVSVNYWKRVEVTEK